MWEEPGDEPSDLSQDGVVVLLALLEGALAPLALAVGWLLSQPPLSGFAWSIRDAAIGVAAALPMLALLVIALRWPIGPLARIRRFLDARLGPVLRDRHWSDLALVSLAAGVGEEMLFRGVLQGALSRWLGPGSGLAIASIVLACSIVTDVHRARGVHGCVWSSAFHLMVATRRHDFVALLLLFRNPGGPWRG